MSCPNKSSVLPEHIFMDTKKVMDKDIIVDVFNKHFIAAGSVCDNYDARPHCSDDFNAPPAPNVDLFDFEPIPNAEVCKALKAIDPKKSAGPDNLDPYLLMTAADIITEPVTYIFNLSLLSNSIPQIWKAAYVLPLLKGGDPSELNNYRPISKLPALAKVLESLVNSQLKNYLSANNILSEAQSGFRTGHSTISAALSVTNDIINTLDKKQHCAALFIDLSKAFDSVDHALLLTRLSSIGLSHRAVGWFRNYITNRTQCVNTEGHQSSFLEINKGVPQGSILAPALFSIFINDLGKSLKSAKVHLYADDTVIYTEAPSPAQAVKDLHSAFQSLQANLHDLKLRLNAKKTKFMIFTRARSQPSDLSIFTSGGTQIERVSTYKYLGMWLDDKLTFKIHIDALVKKLRVKLGFYFRNKSCFSLEARKKLVHATFLSVIDYGDVLYMHAASSILCKLDSAYHASLRFITKAKSLTHHCTLYQLVGWTSLSLRRQQHWYIFIYKAILGKLPPYLCRLFVYNTCTYNLRSTQWLLYKVPRACSELGKTAFSYHAPWSWNNIQNLLKLEVLIPLSNFKSLVQGTVHEECNCVI